ncbi:hypothetical protein H8356DRAFT_1419028 [Neocallimastix lanati (nom. inval.)]|nr:hypothetical protein H8356DRAFT_1419028 [Neocallimastix sp. JGI-2020a]
MPVPAILKKYWPNGRPESWNKFFPNCPPEHEFFEDCVPGEVPPKLLALYPDGLPEELDIFKDGMPDDFKQFMAEATKEHLAALEKQRGSVPEILKKYWPNGRPEAWKKLFPNGPPPLEYFEDAVPGEIPPKIKALFPNGAPPELNIFKNGMPEDFKQFLSDHTKILIAKAKVRKYYSGPPAILKKYWPNGRPEAWNKIFPNCPPPIGFFEGATPGEFPPKLVALFPNGLPPELDIFKNGIPADFKRFLVDYIQEKLSLLEFKKKVNGMPDAVKKIWPNGRPESWCKIFPGGPPPLELFEGATPGQVPPRMKEIFPYGFPSDLDIFKNGVPDDLKELMADITRQNLARLEVRKSREFPAILKKYWPNGRPASWDKYFPNSPPQHEFFEDCVPGEFPPKIMALYPNGLPADLDVFKNGVPDDFKQFMAEATKKHMEALKKQRGMGPVPAILKKYWPNGRPEAWKKLFPNGPPPIEYFEDAVPGSIPPKIKALFPNGAPPELSIFKNGMPEDFKQFLSDQTKILIAAAKLKKMRQGPPAIIKKYWPNGRPEAWNKLFPNGPPSPHFFEGATPGQLPPKIKALFPNGAPPELNIFKNGMPEDFKQFLSESVRENLAILEARKKMHGVPAVVRKYWPNGRPESWCRLFPNGPPPLELFEGATPGELPPKMKELFPYGVPSDLDVFKNGVPEDFKQFMAQATKQNLARLEAKKRSQHIPAILKKYWPNGRPASWAKYFPNSPPQHEFFEDCVPGEFPPKIMALYPNGLPADLDVFKNGVPDDFKQFMAEATKKHMEALKKQRGMGPVPAILKKYWPNGRPEAWKKLFPNGPPPIEYFEDAVPGSIPPKIKALFPNGAPPELNIFKNGMPEDFKEFLSDHTKVLIAKAKLRKMLGGPPAILKKYWPNGRPEAWNKIFPNCPPGIEFYEGATPGEFPPKIKALFPNGLPAELDIFKNGMPEDFKQFLYDDVKEKIAILEDRKRASGVPAVIKKYWPNGRPESWCRLFPNGPPPLELFEGATPGKLPPKMKELFPYGVPKDLDVFKNGVPEDIKEFMTQRIRRSTARLHAKKLRGPPAILKKYWPNGRPESWDKIFPNCPPAAEYFENAVPGQIPPKILALFPNGRLPDDLDIFKNGMPDDFKEFLEEETKLKIAELNAKKLRKGPPAVIKKYWPNGRPEVWNRLFPNGPPPLEYFEDAIPGEVPPRIKALFPNGAPKELVPFEGKVPDDLKQFMIKITKEKLAALEARKKFNGPPDLVKKYWPNGRPEAWEKLFPNGPPPPQLFEDAVPGEVPPKIKALFPYGTPKGLNIFEHGVPEDFKQYLVENMKQRKSANAGM